MDLILSYNMVREGRFREPDGSKEAYIGISFNTVSFGTQSKIENAATSLIYDIFEVLKD